MLPHGGSAQLACCTGTAVIMQIEGVVAAAGFAQHTVYLYLVHTIECLIATHGSHNHSNLR